MVGTSTVSGTPEWNELRPLKVSAIPVLEQWKRGRSDRCEHDNEAVLHRGYEASALHLQIPCSLAIVEFPQPT